MIGLRRIAITTLVLGMTGLLTGIAPVPVKSQSTEHGYPARIVTGSCAAPGDEVFSLTGVGASLDATGSPVPEMERLGADDAIPLTVSTTILDGASITALTDDPHAIAIDGSDAAANQMVACGAVGGLLTRQMAGMIMPGDILNVGLGSVNDSGLSGIATLQSVEGGNLRVTILLTIGK